jgi:hypothetical protein
MNARQIMIRKIISGGQPGADRAALNAAILMGISHGGWIPKGRITEDGTLPDKYELREMPTSSHQTPIEQNVIDSDGTLIFFRGKPTGGTEFTRKIALQHDKQLLLIDLNNPTSYDAASLILSWISLQKIKVLNVSGPSASKDSGIYGEVLRILKMAITMGGIKKENHPLRCNTAKEDRPSKPPITVEEAVERLIMGLSLRDKSTLVNMAETELCTLNSNLGKYIRNEFDLWSGNIELLTSCCYFVKRDKIDQDEASSIIIREAWKQLGKTHRLRIIK